MSDGWEHGQPAKRCDDMLPAIDVHGVEGHMPYLPVFRKEPGAAVPQGRDVRLSADSDTSLALSAGRDCPDFTPRAAGTSADHDFRADRHGGGVATPYRGGSAGPSSRVLVRDSRGFVWRWRPRHAPVRLS